MAILIPRDPNTGELIRSIPGLFYHCIVCDREQHVDSKEQYVDIASRSAIRLGPYYCRHCRQSDMANYEMQWPKRTSADTCPIAVKAPDYYFPQFNTFPLEIRQYIVSG